MRIFGGFALIAAFIVWLAYRVYKKDLKQHKQALYVYLSFVVVWVAIYSAIYFL